MSSVTRNKRRNCNRSLPQIIQADRRHLTVLPDPETEWLVSDLDSDYVRNQLERLLSNGIVERVSWNERYYSNSRVGVYRTTSKAWDRLQQCQKTDNRNRLLPCDETDCPGEFFTNPRDRDGIVCKDCGEEHDPDEL